MRTFSPKVETVKVEVISGCQATYLCSFLLSATFLTTSIALRRRQWHQWHHGKQWPFIAVLSYFLCATLRLAGSASTTNTPSFLPADTEVEGSMWVWVVRWRREGIQQTSS